MAGILGVAAVIETITGSAGSGDGALFVVVLCLLALGGTLPLALPGPAAAGDRRIRGEPVVRHAV